MKVDPWDEVYHAFPNLEGMLPRPGGGTGAYTGRTAPEIPQTQAQKGEANLQQTLRDHPEFRDFYNKFVGKDQWVRAYHGTGYGPVEPGSKFNIPSDWERGVFFTPDPKTAGAYAGHPNDGFNSKIFPVDINVKNALIHDAQGRGYSETPVKRIIDDARDKGHDFAIFRNMYDVGGNHDQIVGVRPAGKVKSALSQEVLLGLLGGLVAPQIINKEDDNALKTGKK